MADGDNDWLSYETASDLMNARVSQITSALYAEQAKPDPDAPLLAALNASLVSVENDRRSMRGVKPITVLTMIEKYSLLLHKEPGYHE